jgi:hypothetical protein
VFHLEGQEHRISYLAAPSDFRMFGMGAGESGITAEF